MTQNLTAACFHCSRSFDTARSEWCDCVQRMRSLVCTRCGHCSCDAPAEWKEHHGTRMLRPLFSEVALVDEDHPVEPAGVRFGALPRVLIVDDDVFVQRLAREGLAGEFDVTTARDGLEGFARALDTLPHVVVTDALMPTLDGRELCRVLKNHPKTAESRVVIMTALYRSARHEREAIRDYGADVFLRKPFTISELGAIVRSLLPANLRAAVDRSRQSDGWRKASA